MGRFSGLMSVLLALSSGASATELPLMRGFYVDTSTTCSNASNATLFLLQRDQLVAGGREICTFAQIVPKDSRHFVVNEVCETVREMVVEWTIEGEGRFSRTYANGESHSAQFCPQSSLPEPWRNNDISDRIR
ncbi:hypothetical protein [Pararhizobium haloflavum]|uniref:hypothetical protein n=1 Tax=Pararhizobium haloflavum TaxID=2037914 RepID=UPI000C18770C|nr:hypothetical protein [Pararhizobium haloflavum]